MDSLLPTPLSIQPLNVENVEIIAQVGISASPPAADLPELSHQEPSEEGSEVIALYPYMPIFDRMVTVRDYVLVDLEVGFVLGTSLDHYQSKLYTL